MPKEKNGPSLRSKRTPDFATIAGLALAVGGILTGLVLEGGKMTDVSQTTAALIVLAGTFGAVLVTTPLPTFLAAVKRLGVVFFNENQPFAEMLAYLAHCADLARRNGLTSLEDEAVKVDDPFLKKALYLTSDGTDIQEIESMLRLDIDVREQRADAEARVWEAAGGYSPTIGIIGAVLGLIQVMKHLEQIDEVGRGIAVAFVATVYGVGVANILFLPIAAKIQARERERTEFQEMIIEGILSISSGMNPKLIQIKLEAFAKRRKAQVRERASAPPLEARTVPGD